jgi:hypothetical protein
MEYWSFIRWCALGVGIFFFLWLVCPIAEYYWMTKVMGAIPVYDDGDSGPLAADIIPYMTDDQLQTEVLRRSIKSGNIIVANRLKDGTIKIEEFPD